MQTFLPYASGTKSARVLDAQRLGKQRVECLQILASLTDIHKSPARLDIPPGTISVEPHAFVTHSGDVWVWNPNHRRSSWANHPAVRMWDRYEAALVQYSLEICAEWIFRGYRDTTAHTISMMADLSIQVMSAGLTDRGVDPEAFLLPLWWGNEKLHASHQSNLLRKDPVHYGQFFPDADPALDYHWPGQAPGRNAKTLCGGAKTQSEGRVHPAK